MTKRKKPEAPAASAAIAVTDNLDYMAQYPLQMRHTTDVHIVLAVCILPVHSFVLMASSPFFSEIVSSYQTESGQIRTAEPLRIPMPDVAEEALRAALTYLYMEMRPGGTEPDVKDVNAAWQLAEFGHKYQVKLLHGAADLFLYSWLRSEGFDEFKLEKPTGNPKMPIALLEAPKGTSERQRQALRVIRMASLAETYDLPET